MAGHGPAPFLASGPSSLHFKVLIADYSYLLYLAFCSFAFGIFLKNSISNSFVLSRERIFKRKVFLTCGFCLFLALFRIFFCFIYFFKSLLYFFPYLGKKDFWKNYCWNYFVLAYCAEKCLSWLFFGGFNEAFFIFFPSFVIQRIFV